MSFQETLGQQHRECDFALAGIEQAAVDGCWPDAEKAFDLALDRQRAMKVQLVA